MRSLIVAAGRKISRSFHRRRPQEVNQRSGEDVVISEMSSRAHAMDLVPGTTASSAPEQTSAVNCEVCENFTRFGEEVPVEDVNDAAEHGCQACSMLRNTVSAFELHKGSCKKVTIGSNLLLWQEEGRFLELELFTCEGRGFYSLQALRCMHSGLTVVRVGSSTGVPRDGVIFDAQQLIVPLGAPSIWSAIRPARGICMDPSSDDCFGLVQKWFQDCMLNHSICTQTGTYIPTRLIYVGTGSEDPHLRTDFSPAEEEKSATYAALSYCWGPPELIPPAMRTTQSNLSQRLQTIPLETLPKTIQDAIIITRRLGIAFLWVDALCIIQDLEEDWATEASKMSDVYQNATVTIAAEGASSSQEGCFLAGQPRPTSALVYRGDSKKQQGNVYARQRLPNLAHVGRYSNDDAWPLRTRAWTLQEGLLSSRILHYTRFEVAWSCTTYTCCECTLSPQPIDPWVSLKTWVHSNRISPESQSNTVSIGHFWLHVVEKYTVRNVTNPSDRLAAISGLAAYMQRYFKDTYLAGLWKSSLAEGLLWSVWSDSSVSRRHEEYLAPTWSWASVTGKVSFLRTDTVSSQCLRIVDASCRVVGQNPYGAAADGQLTVTGLLSPARLRKTASTVPKLELVGPSDGKSYFQQVYLDVGDVHDIDLDEPYFLLMTQFGHDTPYLLLRKAVSGPRGHEYERLGMVWADIGLVPAIDALETSIVIV